MKKEDAAWIATLDVAGCEKQRSREIAGLVTDVALVALQLVIPWDWSQRMARVTGRTLPGYYESVSIANGRVSMGAGAQLPGHGLSGAAFVSMWR